jgi:hypothetical protein
MCPRKRIKLTKTARLSAGRHRMILQTLSDAEDADWKRLVGEHAWTFLFSVDAPQARATAVSRLGARFGVPFESALFDSSGVPRGTVREEFWRGWKRFQRPRPIGRVKSNIAVAAGVFVEHEGHLKELSHVEVSATLRARQWPMALATGHVLRDALTDSVLAGRYESDSLDWFAHMQSVPGHEMTCDEYDASNSSVAEIDLAHVNRFTRFSFEHGPETKKDDGPV